MLLFILSGRMELTAYKLFQIHWLLSVREMRHSLLPIYDARQYISYMDNMREPIRYLLDHLDE